LIRSLAESELATGGNRIGRTQPADDMVDDEFVIQCSICGARCPLYGPSGFFVHVTTEHPSSALAQRVAENQALSQRRHPRPPSLPTDEEQTRSG
jgi:hypothetical protein